MTVATATVTRTTTERTYSLLPSSIFGSVQRSLTHYVSRNKHIPAAIYISLSAYDRFIREYEDYYKDSFRGVIHCPQGRYDWLIPVYPSVELLSHIHLGDDHNTPPPCDCLQCEPVDQPENNVSDLVAIDGLQSVDGEDISNEPTQRLGAA